MSEWVTARVPAHLCVCVCVSHQEAGDQWVVDIQSHVLQELKSPRGDTVLLISTARRKGDRGHMTVPLVCLRLSVTVPLILTLFCLHLHSAYLPVFSFPVFLVSLCVVMPHYPTTFNSSFFSLSHTSISLCTLNLSTFFPVPLASLRWSHTHTQDLLWWHMWFIQRKTLCTLLCVLFYQRVMERMEKQWGERDSFHSLCR